MATHENNWYTPELKKRLQASIHINLGKYPYRRELAAVKKLTHRDKVSALLELVDHHHPQTLSHIFEVAFIATSVAYDYFVSLGRKTGYSDERIISEFMPKVEEVFIGSLLHDIGKTAVPINILSSTKRVLHKNDNKHLTDKEKLWEREKGILNLHSQFGSVILNKVGFGHLGYICDQHHIGNSNSAVFHPDDIHRRYPLTEFTALADTVSGMRDKRRSYIRNEATISRVIDVVYQKLNNEKLSPGVVEAFRRVIIEQNKFPPYYKPEDFLSNMLFRGFMEKYRLTDLLKRNLSKVSSILSANIVK